MKHLLLIITILLSVNCIAQKLIIEPGTNHKAGDPIGNSKPQKRLSIGMLETTKGGDSIYQITTVTGNLKIGLGITIPSHSIQFCRDSLNFYINFRGDSLKVGGNIPMAQSAELFINWCHKYMKFKMDSLEFEIFRIRRKIDSLKKENYKLKLKKS